MAAQSASTSTSGGKNWRRIFFYAVEIIFAFIAGSGEAYMYAAYLPNDPGRWVEAFLRAAITQAIIVLFGVAAIEVWRIRNGFARIFITMIIWGVTIGAACYTFWFLWEAAQVFRDEGMLGPLNGATVNLPWGWVIPNTMIDVALIAAVPFFQTALNILGPIITADHAPESLEEQQHKQQLALQKAKFDAEMAQYQGVGFGARLGGVWKGAKAVVAGEQSGGNEHDEPAGNISPFPHLSSVESGGVENGADSSTKGPTSIRKGQWTTKELRDYALTTYRVNISPDAAQSMMSTLHAMGKARKVGTRYVTSMKTGKELVDGKYGGGSSSATPRAINER